MRVKWASMSRWAATLAMALALGAVLGCNARVTSSDTQRFNPFTAPDLEILVLDMNDVVIPDASVTLYEQVSNGAQRVAKGTTDINGVVIFKNPAQGQYILHARKEGYIGTSAYAQVQRTGVIVSAIRMRPLSDLVDVSAGIIDQNGGSISTLPVATLPQSTITFDGSSFAGSATVTIATVMNNQIPAPPPGQVALGAVVIESSDPLSGSATVAVGMPFDLPAGTQIPLFAFNDATGLWEQVAIGTIDPLTGQAVATLDEIAMLSALAGFVPQRVGASTVNPVGPPRTLGPGDPVEITLVYTPVLEFPEGTNYTLKTQEWLKGVMGSILGLEFGTEVKHTVIRDPSTIQTYWVYEHVDDYRITINTAAGKPAMAKIAATYEFRNKAIRRSQELRAVEHNSGTGGGV